MDTAKRRLHNQRLAGTPFERPEDVVRWLCAVQAQDYAAAKWAVALRTTGATDANLDRAYDDGAILRTHVMRPTWHFVMPADIRWLLRLTRPRVIAATSYRHRQLELDDDVLGRARDLFADALEGGKHRTRAELGAALRDGGIEASGERLGHMLMRAELDAIVCSGPRRGKQFTYALFDERVPRSGTLERDEALAELTQRYFTSHGPATLRDYAWWSGLSAADARTGLERVRSRLVQETIDGMTYWLAPPATVTDAKRPILHLLPNFDELLVAYQDRDASFDPGVPDHLASRQAVLMGHRIVMDGRIIGGWRRTLEKNEVIIGTDLHIELDPTRKAALKAAAVRYGEFLTLPATLS